MIKQIIDLLNSLDHYGQSDFIEIAKGRYELPKTFKMAFQQIKRQWKKSQ
jgi:hypothetical protein